MRLLFNLTKEAKLTLWTIIFLCSLYFIPNNKTFLPVIILFIIGLFAILGSFTRAVLFTYILLLPISVGKGIEFLLIPASYINPYRLGETSRPFISTVNFTFSHFLIGVLGYLAIRKYIVDRNRNNTFHITQTDGILFLFFGTTILSGIISNAPSLSLLLTLQLFGYAFVYYFIRMNALSSWVQQMLPFILSAIGIFEGMWSAAQFAGQSYLGRYIENMSSAAFTPIHKAAEDTSFIRFQGTFNHPNDLGMFMASIIPLLVSYSVNRVSVFQQRIALAGLLSACLSLVISGSRASWIVLSIALFFMHLSKRFIISHRRLYVFKNLLRPAFYTVILLFIFLIVPRLMQLQTTLQPDGGVNFRLDLIQKAMTISYKYPLGIGLGMFPQALFLEFGGYTSTPTQPHNLLAQILAASGVLGLISFTTYCYQILKPVILRLRSITDIQFASFISVSVFLLLSMFYPILNEQVFSLLWILLAVVV